MGGKIGNQNAKGNRGGGRKSAYQEQADAKMLWQMFFGDLTLDAVKAKIESGEYSVKDMLLLKAMEGDVRVMSDMFKKIFPDLQKAEHSGGIDIKIVDYEPKRDSNSAQL